MNDTEVIILNGPPGSGKSTLANEIVEQLREADIANAIIDVDELARTYPEQERSFQWNNLGAIWPSYATIPGLKAVIPVLIDTEDDLDQLRTALPAARFIVCELVAPETLLKNRVTAREPNAYWQSKLRGLVDKYIQRQATERFGDFQVDTSMQPVHEVAKEVMRKVGWLT
jgi:chloramphenicol 3-O-phosphotransferase